MKIMKQSTGAQRRKRAFHNIIETKERQYIYSLFFSDILHDSLKSQL